VVDSTLIKVKIRTLFSWKVFLFIGLSLFLSRPAVVAEELPVDFSGDHLEYLEQQGIIIGQGNVEVKYKGMKAKADWAKVDLKKKKLFAKGNVVLFERGEKIYGESLVYDLKTARETMTKARTFLTPWYIWANSLKKIAKNEYLAEKGKFTTDNPAEFPKPHYRFAAGHMNTTLSFM